MTKTQLAGSPLSTDPKSKSNQRPEKSILLSKRMQERSPLIAPRKVSTMTVITMGTTTGTTNTTTMTTIRVEGTTMRSTIITMATTLSTSTDMSA